MADIFETSAQVVASFNHPPCYSRMRAWAAATPGLHGTNKVLISTTPFAGIPDEIVTRTKLQLVESHHYYKIWYHVFADDDARIMLEYSEFNKSFDVEVYSYDAQRSATLLTELKEIIGHAPEPEEDKVHISFWSANREGQYSGLVRTLDAVTWSAIDANYAAQASEHLSRLMTLDTETINGKLILLHGPPGTGKTTVIRALARSWRDWCIFHYITDPERFFGESAYMTNVLLQPTSNEKWKLIIVEDAEEFVLPGAKNTAGQSVARLLNLCDGLIGQGLKILVLLTTNVPITSLHAAMTRPGRCLANIEVPKLSAAEATAWLGQPIGSSTLAELYAARHSAQILGDGVSQIKTGQYV